jgi:cytoskeletal protein CcmA (bactofilin family)
MKARTSQLSLFAFFILLTLILSAVIAMPAQAAQTRTGNNVSLRTGQVVNDDLYAAGGTVSIDGNVNGDVMVAGGTVIINGLIRDNLMVTGGNVTINTAIGKSVRVAAGNVVINAKIGKDLVAAGGTIDLSKRSTVQQDALVSGGTVNLNGNIGRKLQGTAGMMTIAGTVNGNSNLNVDQLTLVKGANLKGNLIYRSQNKAKIESGATVSGKTIHKQAPAKHRKTTPGERAANLLISFILSFVAAYIFGVVLLLLFPRRVGDIANTVTSAPWPSLGIGFLAFIVVPIAALILCLFIVTIPISLTIMLLYLLGLYLAKVFVGLSIGRWLFDRFKWGENDFLALFVGLLVLMLLALIPVIGWLVRFLYVLFGLGAAIISLYKLVLFTSKERKAAEKPLSTSSQAVEPGHPGEMQHTGEEGQAVAKPVEGPGESTGETPGGEKPSE